MEGSKDISEMSFEEFFADAKKDREKEPKQKAKAPAEARRAGFAGAGPKINYNAGKFLLYIPRYSGFENDQFNAAVECKGSVVPMGRLEAVKQKSARVTRPATLDLTLAEATPMDDFTVTLDGISVFENKACDIAFFNSIGLPLAKPAGEVTVVHRTGTSLRTTMAKVLSSTVKGPLTFTQVDVSLAGGVWIGEPEEVSEPASEPKPAEKEASKPAAPKAPKAPKKVVKKAPVKGRMSLSNPCPDAQVCYREEYLDIYAEPPVLSVSVEGCEIGECVVRVLGPDGNDMVDPIPAGSKTVPPIDEAFGPIDVSLERSGKTLAEARFFMIPGFSCACPGKGDLTGDTVVSYTMFGEEGTRDVLGDDPYSFEHDGTAFEVVWEVPVATYDIGDGPVPVGLDEIDIRDIKGDRLRVTVRGARKKTVFFGGAKGKKRDVTPDWNMDSYDIDMPAIRDEVFSSPASEFCFYITVNSNPNKPFLKVKNPVRLKGSFADGKIVVDVDQELNECRCLLFKLDKSVEEVPLVLGANEIEAAPDVIEAEAVEYYAGAARVNIPIVVRKMPFVHVDGFGDRWLYISRSKRVPVPDDLYKNGVPDLPSVKAWHDRIVRMNPELKGVSFDMMKNAFTKS